MKSLAPLTIAISLAILSATSLPIFAQAQRYPTDIELQELNNQLRSFAASPPSDESRGFYIRDRRDRQSIQQLNSFVKAWSQIEPEAAPFFGNWTGLEETKSIYPSTVKGRVCIVDTFIPPNDGIGISFSQGTLYKGKIKTSDPSILIALGNFLGVAFVNEKNQPGIYEYAWPKPLKNPAELMRFNPSSERNRLLQQFKTAGCTYSLPNKS